MKQNKKIGPILLLTASLLWGVAFVAQSVGVEKVQPFTFNGIRTLIGAVSLIPVLRFLHIKRKKTETPVLPAERKQKNKIQMIAGLACGVALYIASSFQQFALKYTESGKVAFITALYMVFVPVGGLFLGNKIRKIMLFCLPAGLVGMFLLCAGDGISNINKGDLLALACSVCFTVHILLIDRFVDRVDGVMLSATQFLVSGILGLISALIFETINPADLLDAVIPILYAGIGSCGLAFTFQIVGQKYTDASVAPLLMCMESVFGAIASALYFKTLMSVRETVGCVLMFAAIVVSQLPEKKKTSVGEDIA